MLDFRGLLILMVVIWSVGKLFRSIGLPVVFGELLGGIIVGPAVLNLVEMGPVIEVLAELGIFFLMLHAGLETDIRSLLAASKSALLVAIAGIALPYVATALVALLFGQTMQVAMFIGLCASLTSIALVMRLLKEVKLHATPLGQAVIAASILTDIFGLILFSVQLNLHTAGTFDLMYFLIFTGRIAAFFIIVLLGGSMVSPYLNKVIYFGNKGFTLTMIMALCLGLFAEYVGLHMVIGSFLAGLFISSKKIDTRTYQKIEDRIYALSYSFFGPIFFASLAFSVDFSTFVTMPQFMIALIITACITKFVSVASALMFTGFNHYKAAVGAVFMNNRGSVELIIAVIGLQAGIINTEIFSLLVILSFITTLVAIIFGTRMTRNLQLIVEPLS